MLYDRHFLAQYENVARAARWPPCGTTMASRVAHNVLSGCASRAREESMYISRGACVCVLETGCFATGIFWLNMKTLLERRDVLHGGTTMASRVAHNVLSGCASRAWEERMYILRRACVCVLEMGLLLCRLTHCHHKYHYFEQKNSHYMAKILERRDGQKAQAEKTLT